MSLTVTELNNRIKRNLTENFSGIMLTGEVDDFKMSKSHWYFYLKEKTSMIKVIVWLSKQKNVMTNGDMINANGYVDFYEKGGSISFIINSWNVISNEGLLQKEMEKWKKSYEGFFHPLNKCASYIETVVVITSEEGAALRDFLYVTKTNKFSGNICVLNSSAQGEKCIEEVCFQMKKALALKPQVVIITRGGGSLEDLINYSKPEILSGIQNLKENGIFTIAAVGHESDTMLCDFIADLRCPTPSLAAEFIVSQNKRHCQEFKNIIDFIKDKIFYYRNEIKQIKQMFEANVFIEYLKDKYTKYIFNERLNIDHIKQKISPKFTMKSIDLSIMSIDDIVNSHEVILQQGEKTVKCVITKL